MNKSIDCTAQMMMNLLFRHCLKWLWHYPHNIFTTVIRKWTVGNTTAWILLTQFIFFALTIIKQECQSEWASRDFREASSKNGNSNQKRAVEQSVFMSVSDQRRSLTSNSRFAQLYALRLFCSLFWWPLAPRVAHGYTTFLLNNLSSSAAHPPNICV